MSTEDEDPKAERQEAKALAMAQKFEKFHPIELYVFFAYGPAVLGGCGSVHFLKEAKDIQASVAKKTVNSRGKSCEKNAEEMDEQADSKKTNVVLSDTMQDSPTVGSSFTLQYEDQLKIERERLHEDTSALRQIVCAPSPTVSGSTKKTCCTTSSWPKA